jgi:hypothetical protein
VHANLTFSYLFDSRFFAWLALRLASMMDQAGQTLSMIDSTCM